MGTGNAWEGFEEDFYSKARREVLLEEEEITNEEEGFMKGYEEEEYVT